MPGSGHAHRRDAFLRACRLDVQVRKPGNVSIASPGHGMDAALFLASAEASVGPLCAAGVPVGRRIEAAMRATLAVARCNTNLGILLLCAPLALAHERAGVACDRDTLRASLRQVLSGLDLDDAAAAFRAIAVANPGGLGSAPEQDVSRTPSVTLLDAMALAAHRDRIAWQYVQAHDDIFSLALPAFDAGRAGRGPDDIGPAMQRAYLEILASIPDSHIVRKHGEALAQCVMREARPWCDSACAGFDLDANPAFAAWDESLKLRRINPGTSADLCVATAFTAFLCDASHAARGLP